MTFSNNPAYQKVFEIGGHEFFAPADVSNYHKSRELAMQACERYANAGISKEVLQALCDSALKRINEEQSRDTLRTDMAVLWNNLLARTKSPVDDECAVRMGAVACFITGEDPDTVVDAFTRKKLALAEEFPELYTFFLSMGAELLPLYKAALHSSNIQDYLMARAQTLQGLTLQNTPKTA